MVTDNQTLVDYGLSIADAAGAVYKMTTTGLGGEFVTWSTECDDSDDGESKTCDPRDAIQIVDGRFRLRPEVLETWYYAYRATRDPKYREWSWEAFEAINRYCRTDSGFSAIRDVNAEDGGGKTDTQESFVFAEVMKYVYLTHLEVGLFLNDRSILFLKLQLTLHRNTTGQEYALPCTGQSDQREKHLGVQYGGTPFTGRGTASVAMYRPELHASILLITHNFTPDHFHSGISLELEAYA